jgi:hypothetical protein
VSTNVIRLDLSRSPRTDPYLTTYRAKVDEFNRCQELAYELVDYLPPVRLDHERLRKRSIRAAAIENVERALAAAGWLLRDAIRDAEWSADDTDRLSLLWKKANELSTLRHLIRREYPPIAPVIRPEQWQKPKRKSVRRG